MILLVGLLFQFISTQVKEKCGYIKKKLRYLSILHHAKKTMQLSESILIHGSLVLNKDHIFCLR